MRGGTSSPNGFPPDLPAVLKRRHRIIKTIRTFFDDSGYIAVETPVRVFCPGIDPYVAPLSSGNAHYLATSPELHMKRLLAAGLDKIYQLTRAFRRDESGRFHNPEFSMLEWYRKGADCRGMMLEAEALLRYICDREDVFRERYAFPFLNISVDDLFAETCGWRPSTDWNEDRYFRDWAEKVDPFLESVDAVFITDFPAPLAALSKLKDQDSRICDRIELYLNGVEIANAYSELTDLHAHQDYIDRVMQKSTSLGKHVCAVDAGFMDAVKKGIPESGGIALGIDRLVMCLLGEKSIQAVMAFPETRL